MILPSGSAAMAIDTEGKCLLVVNKEDDILLLIDHPIDSQPIKIKLGNGQGGFDELKDNIKRMEIFTGD